jgi:hypothetical protein
LLHRQILEFPDFAALGTWKNRRTQSPALAIASSSGEDEQ